MYRLVNAFFTRTYDNPDEYWQAQEVAHHMVFGYGYITWEWQSCIRSYAHPMLFATLYKVVAWLHLDQTMALIWAPKLLQACFAAITDYATYNLAKRVINQTIAPYILLITLCSWYNYFIAARTLSNAMEAMFTVSALNYWPLSNLNKSASVRDYRVALLLAGMACIMRPTNGLVWLFLGMKLILGSSGRRVAVLFNAAVIVSLVVTGDILLNSWMYGELVLTPLNFVKVNVLDSISLIYGVHPWHWYLSQGVPVVLTTLLPLTLFGGYKAMTTTTSDATRAQRLLVQLIVWVIGIYSLLSHKEFRFIYPILPIMLVLAASGLAHINSSNRRRAVMLLLVITQLPMAFYLNLWHQRGVVDVMLWLRDQSDLTSLGVLMPCHSTPWQSMIHRPNTSMWFLTCEPPLDAKKDYVDEADRFYADPVKFLSDDFDKEWPSHLLMFEQLLQDNHVTHILKEQQGYHECARFFNSHFHDDWRRQGDVIALCK